MSGPGRLFFEDVPLNEVRETGRHTMSREEVLDFATEFDPQPFHIDEAAAKDSIFGGLIASGWHTAAVQMRLLVDGFINDYASLGSPGFDDLRWLKPVRPGDTIRARAACIEKIESRSRPDMGVCRFRIEVLNQDDDVVMTLVSLGMIRRRPT